MVICEKANSCTVESCFHKNYHEQIDFCNGAWCLGEEVICIPEFTELMKEAIKDGDTPKSK